eukprot:15915294-Heterocapsa_arctica.AAC.1
MAYELNTTQDSLHAANCKWESDNMRVTAQIAAVRSEISDAQERSASAFTRDSAARARAVMALEDNLAKHIVASEK